jgi:hypothetical protein
MRHRRPNYWAILAELKCCWKLHRRLMFQAVAPSAVALARRIAGLRAKGCSSRSELAPVFSVLNVLLFTTKELASTAEAPPSGADIKTRRLETFIRSTEWGMNSAK